MPYHPPLKIVSGPPFDWPITLLGVDRHLKTAFDDALENLGFPLPPNEESFLRDLIYHSLWLVCHFFAASRCQWLPLYQQALPTTEQLYRTGLKRWNMARRCSVSSARMEAWTTYNCPLHFLNPVRYHDTICYSIILCSVPEIPRKKCLLECAIFDIILTNALDKPIPTPYPARSNVAQAIDSHNKASKRRPVSLYYN
jgi:hypothetical protein